MNGYPKVTEVRAPTDYSDWIGESNSKFETGAVLSAGTRGGLEQDSWLVRAEGFFYDSAQCWGIDGLTEICAGPVMYDLGLQFLTGITG